MTMNTLALPQHDQKAVPSSSAGDKGDGGKTSQEAANQFQGVLSNLRAGKASGERGGQPPEREADAAPEEQADAATENTTGPRDSSPVSASETGQKDSFPVSNLTDALRKVSQTVMGNSLPSAQETGRLGMADGNTSGAAKRYGFPGSLPLGAVLAAGGGMVMPNQTAPQGLPSVAGFTRPATETTSTNGTSSLFAQFGVEPEPIREGASGRRASRAALPEEAAGTVKVLRQETHFAPNLRLSPAQQVGEQIASALKDMPSDTGRVPAGLTAKAEGPVLKTLDIQLTPHELGTVKVSLRMIGDTVEVSLATSNPKTAELLKQDRQLLDQMLRTTGFKADAITIQAADDRGIPGAGSSGNSSAQGQQGTHGGAFGDNQNQGAFGNGAGGRGGRAGGNDGTTYPGFEPVVEQGHEDQSGSRLSDGIYM